MLKFETIDDTSLKALINVFYSQRPRYSNYFFPELTNMSVWHSEKTLVLNKLYEGYSRIYYLSTDRKDLTNALKECTTNMAINIPSKNGVDNEMLSILSDAGYGLFQTYERMYINGVDARGEYDPIFAKKEDIDDIIDISYRHFHPISDRLLSRDEFLSFIEKKQIFITRDHHSKKVNGLIAFSIDGNKCNFIEWVSEAPMGESLYLYLNGFNYMAYLGLKNCTLWYRVGNDKPRKIYDALGFKLDGLRDYTFLKK